jgi:hypothetical protein
MTVHLVKLCVGADSVADLEAWQAHLMKRLDRPVHHTRMMPKKAKDLLDGGSIYWVIRRAIRVRQPILDIRRVEGADGRSLCELVFDPTLVAVRQVPRKPFQGWRYLTMTDAPPDLGEATGNRDVPPELDAALKAALVW